MNQSMASAYAQHGTQKSRKITMLVDFHKTIAVISAGIAREHCALRRDPGFNSPDTSDRGIRGAE